MPRNTVWFSEIGREDVALAGGKGASLGEMVRHNIPVPPGFVVTSDTYSRFLDKSGLSSRIRQILSTLDSSDTENLKQVSAEIMAMFKDTPMPPEVAWEIKKSYGLMGDGSVAVRSSATEEDSADVSFAGQHSTFLNVKGEDKVVEAVKDAWASIFEARAIHYRDEANIDHLDIKMAVPVQKMVQAKVAGVMFTVAPGEYDFNKILVDAVYGLGESLVSGDATPDSYMVSKDNLEIIDKEIKRQEFELVRNTMPWSSLEDASIKVEIPKERQKTQKLGDKHIKALAKLGSDLEVLYGFPVDIEWALEDDEIYILQTRPMTTL